MQSILTIYLRSDRTQITVIQKNAKGLELSYIKSIPEFLDLDDDISNFLKKMKLLKQDISVHYDKIRICFPTENIFVHQFPAVKSSNQDGLNQLLELEIRQAYPQHSLEDYHSIVLPLTPKLDGSEMMIALMIEKEQLIVANQISEIFDLRCENVYISHFAAHGALLYNYPDQTENTIIVIGIQNRFADISVLKKGVLAYYGIVPYNFKEDVGKIFDKEIEKLLSEYIPFADSAYIFGPGLTSEVLSLISKILPLPIQRLNPFRMMTTKLSNLDREYCTKAAHLFPANIGTSLPQIQSEDMIKL